jgi:hypothetical protein
MILKRFEDEKIQTALLFYEELGQGQVTGRARTFG